jgi:exosortase A
MILLLPTFPDWREMAHQWWDIDTYSHILLIPPILAWLVWLRREQLAQVAPVCWWPGIVWSGVGLAVWLAGRSEGINLLAQAGAVLALQGAAIAFIGLRAALILAFPLAYAVFLVPFGDEIIAPLQQITARLAVGLTHWSGVPARLDGLFIDTPAGRFVVAEECSGVKFLIAMVALGTLVAWTAFRSWTRRGLLVAGAALVSILANGVRAWGTIYVAQHVGIERAGSFDHIVYGWVFFAVVIAAVLAAGWRFFERDPAEAGLTRDEVAAHPAVRLERFGTRPGTALAAVVALTIAFAALERLV